MSLSKNNMTPIPRPDLAAYPAGNKPIGYIGEVLFPRLRRMAQYGTLYYQSYYAADSATSGRSSGAAVTGIQTSHTKTTWTGVEKLARIQTDEHEIEMLGGPDAAEKVLALRGHRSLWKAVETSIIAAIDFAHASDVHADPYAGIVAAVAAMKPKVQGHMGKFVLVGGSTALNALRNDSTVTTRMKNIGVMLTNGSTADAREVGLSALAQVFQVSECHEGIDGYWPAKSVAVAWAPDANEDPTLSAQLGRTVFYDFDGQSQTVKCEEGYDPSLRSNYLDFISYINVLTLNADFIAPLQVVA